MMHSLRNIVVLFLLLLTGNGLLAQSDENEEAVQPTISTDSVTDAGGPQVHIKRGSIFTGRPGKSMLMSLIVPGAGQIYNKSYLRVPFVWGAVGGTGAVLVYNSRQYKCTKEAYIASVDGVPYTPPANCAKNLKALLSQVTDGPTLKLLRDRANADRQLMIVVFSLVWLANGVDAFVDAHLKDFDIDENLSINVGPKFDSDPYAPVRMGIYVQF